MVTAKVFFGHVANKRNCHTSKTTFVMPPTMLQKKENCHELLLKSFFEYAKIAYHSLIGRKSEYKREGGGSLSSTQARQGAGSSDDGLPSPDTWLRTYANKAFRPCAPALAQERASLWISSRSREVEGDSPSKTQRFRCFQMNQAVRVVRVASPLRCPVGELMIIEEHH